MFVPDQAAWYIAGNVMPGHFAATDTAKSFARIDPAQPSWVSQSQLFDPQVTTESAEDAGERPCLDPSDPGDGNETTLSSVGYTNLEMYLNEIAGDCK